MVRVGCRALQQYSAALFESVGVPPLDAVTGAESLMEADLRGVASHGTTRVGIYVERFQAGAVNPRPTIAVIRETPTTVLLDGDNGLGAVVGVRAMDEAIRHSAWGGPSASEGASTLRWARTDRHSAKGGGGEHHRA